MPTSPSPAQIEASRANGARSGGPATAAGKARAAMNAVRHGLSGRIFFLLADEDPAAFAAHEATWLAVWAPRDLHEREAALAAIRTMWREIRADRLEAAVLGELFGADALPDPAERAAARDRAFKALSTLLRYRGRIEREHRQAMAALEELRRRRLGAPAPVRRREPEPAPVAPAAVAPRPSEPEPSGLNRHQRRALAAMTRQEQRRAA
jgi:hypothetical protein